jgi:hypothetical protein
VSASGWTEQSSSADSSSVSSFDPVETMQAFVDRRETSTTVLSETRAAAGAA